jgi:hypothetical protein
LIFESPSWRAPIRAQHHTGRIRGFPIGAPGFEPGTSATRTQRSTGLSHAPKPVLISYAAYPRQTTHFKNGVGWASLCSAASRDIPLGALRANHHLAPLGSTHAPDLLRRSPRGFEFMSCCSFKRTGWDSNPRGREPTRFPIVRLKPLGHPSSPLGSNATLALCFADRAWVRFQDPVGLSKTEGVGLLRCASRVAGPARWRAPRESPLRPARLEPHAPRSASQIARGFESKIRSVCRKRREWDSNPRGP